MVECKLCEQQIGNPSDYDAVIKHAELYHFDVFDSFPNEKIRDFILLGDINGELEYE